ncbi:hypothetical protein AZO1586I_1703, partial [Bathymodiolus thermophilus thioautotrophic gill symbiont]
QLAAGANLNITANTLNNTQNTAQTQGGLIYAKNQLHITAANQLLNDKSSIVAQGSILINDTNNNSSNGTNNNLNLVINNKSGVIKSDNNITINAKILNNTAYRYDAKQDDNDGYYGYDVNEKVVKSDYVMDQTLVLEQDEAVSTLASQLSLISAGNNITITASQEINNLSSIITASNDVTINTNTFKNNTDSIDTHNLYRKWGKMWQEKYCEKKRNWWSGGGCKRYAYRTKYADIVDSRSEVVYSINKAAISAGNNLTINATTIINGYNTDNPEYEPNAQAPESAPAANADGASNDPILTIKPNIDTDSQIGAITLNGEYRVIKP